jgi:hypothetical protein
LFRADTSGRVVYVNEADLAMHGLQRCKAAEG